MADAVLPEALQTTLATVRGDCGHIVFLTGAGISAESGIPTFRGKEGYWVVGSKHYRPMEMATQESFRRMPEEVWRWYLYRRTVCRGAAPNAGHLALVRAEESLGDRFRLVTQNVDGLHLRAGNTLERTRQIHGNVDFMRILEDGLEQVLPIPDAIAPHDREDPFSEEDRAHLTIGGRLARPHVLWFDEYYDERLFQAETALQDAARADLLVVIGTTGTTNLPVQIGQMALRRGIPLVDVNTDDNPFAEAAADSDDGFALRGSASRWLPPLVDALVS